LVYSSWLIIGVFGLGISQYGLAGVEAAMLEDRHLDARDTMALLMHSRHSWSGPGGRIQYLGMLTRGRKSSLYRLWWLLALLSLLVTIALPMSCLTMELADGFVKASDAPLTIGYFPETFNKKNDIESTERERRRWQVAASLALPGIGIAYTPPGLDRSQYDYLKEVPNSLSTGQDVPDLLLIPQAMHPVSGSAWGLRLSYNCSIVRSVSELKAKKGSLFAESINGTVEFTDHGRSRRLLTAFNTTVENLFAYVEVEGFINTHTRIQAQILSPTSWTMSCEH
jgi:hypothetical protein